MILNANFDLVKEKLVIDSGYFGADRFRNNKFILDKEIFNNLEVTLFKQKKMQNLRVPIVE